MNEAHIDEKREMYKTYSTDKKQRQNQIEKILRIRRVEDIVYRWMMRKMCMCVRMRV